MQTIQGVLRVWKRQLQRDKALLLGPRGCFSSERALLNIELDAPGTSRMNGLGARVNVSFVLHVLALEVNKLMAGTSFHALGDMGRVSSGWSLVDLLAGGLPGPPGVWLLLGHWDRRQCGTSG